MSKKLNIRRKNYYKQLESTALTDIIFLLLIFFLLTSTFVTQTGIKISLPEHKKSTINQVDKNIAIALNKKGQIFVNEKMILKEQLTNTLSPLLKKSKNKTVLFRPDKEISVQKLVEIMDIASASGAINLIIATKIKVNE